jgi:two-component system, OmpR family, phosphate regulon response regulator PhoB
MQWSGGNLAPAAMNERIIVCEDEEDVALLLAHHLEESGYAVSTVGSGAAALEAVRSDRPALVLLDVILPDVSGTQVLRSLREDPMFRNLPVILVTARSEEIDRIIGFELGADDYVTKPFSPRELVLRVQSVLRRGEDTNGAGPDRIDVGPLSIDVARHEVRVRDRTIAVTALEFRLLSHLARNKGRVQRRDDLLETVWQHPGELDTRTVDTHVKRLREKLGPAGAWIETVRGVGYRLRTD